MAPHRDAERLTGLQVGGIGALALMNKPFEPCIERAALQYEWILVNGGRRGLNLRVAVDDLIRVTGARVVDAVRHETPLTPRPLRGANIGYADVPLPTAGEGESR